jgi:hypothetical protein
LIYVCSKRRNNSIKGKREILAVPDNKSLPFSTVVGFDQLVFISGMITFEFNIDSCP